jgi:hypothetical protein
MPLAFGFRSAFRAAPDELLLSRTINCGCIQKFQAAGFLVFPHWLSSMQVKSSTAWLPSSASGWLMVVSAGE